MKIINIGSINIDHVYTLDHFVNPGETISSHAYQVFPGGKGFNQSLALARCGANVFHAGKIGSEGKWLKDYLQQNKVNTSLLEKSSQATGHALIQVIPSGENAIIIHGGANKDLDESFIESVLSKLDPGDFLLLQNEVNSVDKIIHRCLELDVQIVFNPAPMTDKVMDYPLHLVDTLILNQVEASALGGTGEMNKVLSKLSSRFPKAAIVLTLGTEGVIYHRDQETIQIPAKKVSAVDTTAAGDTFIGFLLGEIMAGKNIQSALQTAVTAAAICVTRQGAATSIPTYQAVTEFRTR